MDPSDTFGRQSATKQLQVERSVSWLAGPRACRRPPGWPGERMQIPGQGWLAGRPAGCYGSGRPICSRQIWHRAGASSRPCSLSGVQFVSSVLTGRWAAGRPASSPARLQSECECIIDWNDNKSARSFVRLPFGSFPAGRSYARLTDVPERLSTGSPDEPNELDNYRANRISILLSTPYDCLC